MHSSGSVKTMGPVEWSLLVVLSVIWGGAFFFNRVVLAELAPFTVVLGRAVVAAALLYLLVRVSGQRLPSSPRLWGSFLVMGLLNNFIPFSLILWGQTQISSSLASILNASTPLWTVLLAHFFTTDERLTPGRLSGVLLGLAGVVVVIGPEALMGLGMNVLAQLAVVGAALSYASAGIYGKRFKEIPPLVTATGQLIGTVLLMTPVALLVDRPWQLPMPAPQTWAAWAGLALLCTATAYLIYFRLLSSAGATNLLLVTLLIPVSALILGTTFLGEQLSPRVLVGMGLIGLGLVTIDGRLLKIVGSRLFPPRASAGPTADGAGL